MPTSGDFCFMTPRYRTTPPPRKRGWDLSRSNRPPCPQIDLELAMLSLTLQWEKKKISEVFRDANSHIHSVTLFRSTILSSQRWPCLINIQLRRRFVGYFIGIHRESRGLQLTSGTSLYNKQRKHKGYPTLLIAKDRESRNEEFWNIHELESAIHLSRKEQ